jgi:hypothetical protein
VTPSKKDGYHLEPESHRKIAEVIFAKIKETPAVLSTLINSFNANNGTNFAPKSPHYMTSLGDFIFNKFIQDTPDKPGVPHLTFKPFINTCNQNIKLLNNIQNPEIINFNYLLFSTPPDYLTNEANETSSNVKEHLYSFDYLQLCS